MDGVANEDRDAALLASYRAARVTVEHRGREVGLAALAIELGSTLYVVTAWNPRSVRLGRPENLRRDAKLHAELDRRAISHLRSRSCDDRGEWCEEGFALGGVDEDVAISLARAFDQLAIYRASANGVEVVPCG